MSQKQTVFQLLVAITHVARIQFETLANLNFHARQFLSHTLLEHCLKQAQQKIEANGLPGVGKDGLKEGKESVQVLVRISLKRQKDEPWGLKK